MQIQLIGLNHKTAPIKLREKLVFANDMLTQALLELKEKMSSDILILSTCNRTEIYQSASDSKTLISWLAKFHNIKEMNLKPHLYTFKNEAAFSHACRVAAGLDSMILGETQILGQMKQALKQSEFVGGQGKNIAIFFQKVFETAKLVRTKTGIGASSTTVASTILKVADKIYGKSNNVNILFVGAGEMTELCCKYFSANNKKKLTIANRSIKNGMALAKKVGGHPILIGDIHHTMHSFDIVISSTSSQLPIIGLGMIEKAIRLRKHKPMLLIDLAIPRDIEPEVAELDDIFLYTFDDLAKITEKNIKNREKETAKAELLIQQQCEEFMSHLQQKTVAPYIKNLNNKFEQTRISEVKKMEKDLKKGVPVEQVLDKLSKNLTKKFLHSPTKALNDNAKHKNLDGIEFLKKLFNLKD
ncbi:MAG: glutamyl-tRNA reductase [Proteobacteria bacterium]|jgi:glutamyl-tRNA reductase|nr:glutamyl-tRNA reductase [Pseudomonadota bacterium]